MESGKPSLQPDSVLAVLDVLGLELKLERRSNVPADVSADSAGASE